MEKYNETIDSQYIKVQVEKAELEAHKAKYKYPIKSITITAVILPVLNNFSKSLFNIAKNINELVTNFFFLITIISIFFILMVFIKIMIADIIEEFFNKDHNKMKELEELLRELYLETEKKELNKSSGKKIIL